MDLPFGIAPERIMAKSVKYNCRPIIPLPFLPSPLFATQSRIVSSRFTEHFISRQTTTDLWFFSTSGTGNALNYINLMHQIRRIIMVAQLHVCRRVLLDVRGILHVLEVFDQLLLGFKLAL